MSSSQESEETEHFPPIDFLLNWRHEKQTACRNPRTVERWPAQAQDELADFARDIEESLNGGEYRPTDAELAGIDRGLKAAAEGRFATDKQVEAALAKLRKA